MQSLNIPTMIEFLNHTAVRNEEPVMVWGQPGVGKSEGVAQLAQSLGAMLVDIRLSQYDSVDLRGTPWADEATQLTIWHAPSTLPFVGNPRFPTDRPIILFLDEINSASPSVSAVAYQLVNDGAVGEHKLLPNVYVIAAGNREGDRGVTNRQPLPLSNRFTHCEVLVDADAFVEHAQSRGVAPVGLAFLLYRKPLVSTFDPSKPELKAFATPRTWMKAFKYFMDDQMPTHIKQAAMAGAVGDGPANEFWGFVDVWQKIVPISQIEANPTGTRLPDETSMAYATAINISGHMTAQNTDKLHLYLKRMDPEFTVMAWTLALKRDASLFGVSAFKDYAVTYKAAFETP